MTRQPGRHACSPSAGSPARARAPPSRCAPAACGSGATARRGRSRASSSPRTPSCSLEQPPPLRLARRRQARERARGARRRRSRAATASTSGPPPAASPTACSQHGAARVIALDVGHGQLDWGLRNDERVHVIERVNARDLDPAGLPFAPVAGDDRRLVHLAGQGAAARSPLPRRGGRAAGAGQAAVRARPRAGRQGRRRARRRATAATPCVAAAAAAERSGLAVRGFASSGLPGPKGNRETFIWCSRTGRAVDVEDGARAEPWTASRGARERAGCQGVRTAVLITHAIRRDRGRGAARRSRRSGRRASWSRPPTRPPSTATPAAGLEVVDELPETARPLPRARRRRHDPATRCATTPTRGVPVFGINFGTIGFLAAVERDQLEEGLRRAFSGRFRDRHAARPRDRGGESSARRAQRHHLHPQATGRGRRALLPPRRRGDRPRPLRRARRRHPGRLDRLQPRQRRPDPRLGRRGLRRQLHRPAHAHRARAGRRPRATCSRSRNAARARARSRSRSTARLERELGGGRGDRGPLPRRRRAASPQLPGANFYRRMREKFGQLAG